MSSTLSTISRVIGSLNIRPAILILIALLPTYLIRFKIFSIPTTFLEIMLLLIIAGWLAKKITNKEFEKWMRTIPTFLPKTFLIAVGIFALAATINVFISPNKVAALGIWKAYFIEPIIFFFICIDVFKTKNDAKKIIGALAASAFLVGAMAIIQKFSGWFVPYTFWGKDDVHRVTSFYGFPNAIGLFLAPIFPLLLFELISNLKKSTATMDREKKKNIANNIFLAVALVFSALAIFWAHSAGAIIALIAGALIVSLLNKKTRWIAVLIIVVAGLLIYFNVLPKNITQELLMKDWSGQVRLKMWQETWTMIKDNPILGAGLAGYQTVVAPYHIWPFVEIFLYPHNFILTFWSELGLLGLSSWLALLAIFLTTSLRGTSDATIALTWSALAILIHGLVDVPYFKNDLAILFWLLFVLLFIATRQQNTD